MALFYSYLLLLLTHHITGHSHRPHYQDYLQEPISSPSREINGVPSNVRAYWMRRANKALAELVSPCPFGAFATVIVNHTDSNGLGELVCMGANNISATGNPTLHGEMSAIKNCTTILTDPNGLYRFDAGEAQAAWASLSLYTNAESCPMCASAIRWTGFKEYIYGTSIETLIEQGWGQIRVASIDIIEKSFDLPTTTRLIGGVLTNETDPYFLWQYNSAYACPMGCQRVQGSCSAID